MYNYLHDWNIFNMKMIEHFRARQDQINLARWKGLEPGMQRICRGWTMMTSVEVGGMRRTKGIEGVLKIWVG
ncbi:hypothetical protein LPUS_08365 [Lasallia pustulata]|uniref:Uncharacterized protein n=1 Tax=Lasallia pustulata TaxID=136370 RepID=A0A1W5D5A9_9LECA|nr:hypothetical protein LPUS_08365 [Lasallia pustulata]